MRCPDCGRKWAKKDLTLSACQGCGDPIVPDDLDSLRAKLGVAAQAPPEVEKPIIEAAPEEVPDSVDCPNPICQMSLMGDDLDKWLSSGCPFCSHENPSPQQPTKNPTQVPDSQPDAEQIPIEPVQQTSATLGMLVNIGPMCGQEIQVPIGSVGRKVLSALLPDPWYDPHLEKVSGEHFELSEDFGITDLGSTNGTRMGGKRLVDVYPVVLAFSHDLRIATNIQLCRAPGDAIGWASNNQYFEISHLESGVRICVPRSELPFHLGRLSESGEMERWVKMARLQMMSMGEDETTLDFLSRRHFTVTFSEAETKAGISCDIGVFDGKEEPEVTDQEDGSFLIATRNNNFRFRHWPTSPEATTSG